MTPLQDIGRKDSYQNCLRVGNKHQKCRKVKDLKARVRPDSVLHIRNAFCAIRIRFKTLASETSIPRFNRQSSRSDICSVGTVIEILGNSGRTGATADDSDAERHSGGRAIAFSEQHFITRLFCVRLRRVLKVEPNDIAFNVTDAQ